MILLFTVSIQFLSCQTVKDVTITTQEDTFIPYILPIETEEAIYEKIKPLLLESVLLGVKFKHNTGGWIDIYIGVFRNGYDRDHNLTNRKIFINDTFYPLVFNVDYTFNAFSRGGFPLWNVSRADPKNKRNDISTVEKVPSLEERKKIRGVYKRDYILRHNSPILKIDLEGNIIN